MRTRGAAASACSSGFTGRSPALSTASEAFAASRHREPGALVVVSVATALNPAAEYVGLLDGDKESQRRPGHAALGRASTSTGRHPTRRPKTGVLGAQCSHFSPTNSRPSRRLMLHDAFHPSCVSKLPPRSRRRVGWALEQPYGLKEALRRLPATLPPAKGIRPSWRAREGRFAGGAAVEGGSGRVVCRTSAQTQASPGWAAGNFPKSAVIPPSCTLL